MAHYVRFGPLGLCDYASRRQTGKSGARFIQTRRAARDYGLKRESDLHLPVDQLRYRQRLNGPRTAFNAFVPRRDAVFAVISLDISPIRGHKIGEPAVQIAN